MPTVRRHRALESEPAAVWEVIRDPHHLPRWWPRCQRVEGVTSEAWTMVLLSDRGRPVRADFRLGRSDGRARRRSWTQEIAGTPFERVLAESATAVEVGEAHGKTDVMLELTQRLRGLSRFGGFMVRRAGRRQLDEALDGLERACDG